MLPSQQLPGQWGGAKRTEMSFSDASPSCSPAGGDTISYVNLKKEKKIFLFGTGNFERHRKLQRII